LLHRQSAALVAVTNVAEYLDETAIRRMVLPKTKAVYEKNTGDLKIVLNVLSCVEKTLDRLDKAQIIDEVLPLLWDVRLQDPEVTLRVVSKCLSLLNKCTANWQRFLMLCGKSAMFWVVMPCSSLVTCACFLRSAHSVNMAL
jgi:hypothetical protein